MRVLLRSVYLQIMGRLKKPKPGIHIINSHYVTPSSLDLARDYKIFESYLNYLKQFGRFITLEEATERISKKNIPKNEVLIAFTFDDGFEECYSIIAPLLEKHGTRGTFFINANYIESSKNYQNEFNERVAISSKKPMSWLQITELHKRGHLIGSHNLDHTNFAELSDVEINRQLSENKKILENKLNYNCDYFAWTYGQMQHFPNNALKITNQYHNYIFSGTNYQKYFSSDGRIINRRHLEPLWSKNHLNYFLSTVKS